MQMSKLIVSFDIKSKIALSVKEACQALSIGRTRFYEEIKNKRLKVVHSGRKVMVPIDEIKKFLALLSVDE